jgi:nitrite reductase/ring-hydroxylating ferredoxin subunit
MVTPAKTHVCALAELAVGTARLVEFKGKPVSVFHVESGVYATEEMCPHRAGPLSEGSLVGTTIICPWHGARFDVTTGKVLNGPAARDLKTFPVIVEDEQIYLVEM